MEWAENRGIALACIPPGKPQQNAHVERDKRTVRHEGLDSCSFERIEEVQQIAAEWLWSHKQERSQLGQRWDNTRPGTGNGRVNSKTFPRNNGGLPRRPAARPQTWPSALHAFHPGVVEGCQCHLGRNANRGDLKLVAA